MYDFTGLAFHGHRNEDIRSIDLDSKQNFYRSESNEGNFIGLLKLMAGENEVLSKHLKNCQENAKAGRLGDNEPTFISKSFVNSALFTIQKYLVKTIVDEIDRNGGCFGVLMDGTQDVSCKEQISIVVRYINDTNDISEHTVSIFDAKDTSGKALYESLRTVLTEIGLSLSNVVGCSFDGAPNMRSEGCGVNFYLKENNIKCIFVWCLSHRFNLAVNFAVGSSELIKCILKTAEDSAKLFRSSYIKMNVWLEVAKTTPNFNSLTRLKLIGTTRWSSKQDAMATIMSSETNLFVLIKALIKICNLKNMDGNSLFDACASLNSWLDYGNIVAAFLLHKIFAVIVPTTKFLQKAGLNILDGMHSLNNSYKRLQYFKENLNIDEAVKFIDKTNMLLRSDEEIQLLNCECLIRRPNENEELELIDRIKIEFHNYIHVLQDQIQLKILKQFDRTESIYQEMRIMNPLYAQNHPSEHVSIKKLCEINNVVEAVAMRELKQFTFDFLEFQKRPQYVSILNNNDFERFNDSDSDDERVDLVIEDESDLEETTANMQNVNIHSMQKKKCYCLDCILKYIGANELRKIKFRNICKIYKYIAMLPSTQVKCERDFSKLKLTKTRLRSNLTEKSLQNLLLISLESNMFKNIDLDDIIDYIIAESSRLSMYIRS